MRTTPRKRHELGRVWLEILRPFLRYSMGRDAWVIRGIGSSHGPVFVRRDRR